MGDLYRETMRWIARVTSSGYMSCGNANGNILSKRTVKSRNM